MEKLLKSVIKWSDSSEKIRLNDEKPFSLLYEEILLHGLKALKKSETDFQRFIADEMKEIEPAEIHKQIMNAGFEHILTTNYDYALEKSIHPDMKQIENKRRINETRYSMFRKKLISNSYLWHIHGELSTPNTMNLGYEQYSGYLQKMRNYMTDGLKYAQDFFEPFCKRFKNNEKQIESWVDLFFTNDIYILGLSLDFVEIHLWWLLTYRARQKFKNKMTIINKIVYLSCNKEKKTERLAAKHDLLKATDVSIETLTCDWKDFYSKALQWITNNN